MRQRSLWAAASEVLLPSDACYLREGQEVVLDLSDDFHDVTALVSDRAISY